ncbi:helix-turn-helix transcriptional regulator [Pendulispora albinea]|uniref:Helix-turn-helix transcriptional regulator n=2 Tax=Pendulispora albinea TaxID=2741071 RepID=A0ABZ2LTT6_9BACT
MTRAIVVASAEPQHIVAVRFRPGGAFAFLGTPLDELTDRHVELDEVLPGMRGVEERLASLKTQRPEAAVAELERALLRRMAHVVPRHPLVLGGVDRILRTDTPLRVGELADALGVTRQHLTRQFKVHVGIGPKELDRVIRMTRLTRWLDGVDGKGGDGDAVSRSGRVPRGAQKAPSAAQVAYELGYYDQSHMIHEFKSLTGITPREYASRERGA